MVRLTDGTGQRSVRRPKVAVIYEDVTTGYKYADWFALHGYQATLTTPLHQLERNLKELRPDVIVIGFSSTPTPLRNTVPRLRTTCPHVPIIAMVKQDAEGPDGSHFDPRTSLGADVFMCDSLDPPASPSL